MHVADWLRSLGLEQYEPIFRENEIDWAVLPELTEADLEKLGLSLGARKKLLRAIAGRSVEQRPAPATETVLPAAERRQLTVMFCDLVGSTAYSQRLDAEELGDLIRAFAERVTAEVASFEGHVAKYMGDGVLAYFGWPQAHEDDPERAIRSGLAIVDAVRGLRPLPDVTPQVRIGIATGPVVVGELIGSGEARERSVVGETPNLAARLQTLAEPDAIVIGRRTRTLVGELFEVADLGAHDVKGFGRPVRAWRVLGEGRAEGRFEALHSASVTPLIGREEELALLLRRWERASDGEGQVVLLSGEPGIGKSRLFHALRDRLAGERHTSLSHFCSPYHTNTALYPVIGLLERAVGLNREDPPPVQLDRLGAILALATGDVQWAAPVLAELLAIPVPAGRYPPLELSPQERKERTFRALLDQLAGLAARQPVLALYEDAHWADPTTSELIGRVIERVQRLPVLAVVTFRPEFMPPWAEHGHVTALSLSRLGRHQGEAMVERLAGGKAFPTEVLEQVLARTDGVPLFVEELTKAVLESGLLRDEGDRYGLTGPLPPLAIPATLQDSLMARLDRLAPVKEVAQVAAVIGREFSRELLATVVGLHENELRAALGQLEAAGLVFRHGVQGHAFKHALVRDAAYHSLLKSRRRQLHARIAAALEERFPETVATEPELLAHHYAGAGLAERAIPCWQRAAELAMGRSANLEAIAHCEAAETQLRALPPSPERARAELDVQLAKGHAVRAGKGYSVHEDERVFLRACELCEELGDRIRLAHALRGLWGFYSVSGRWREAAGVASRLDTAAEGLSDRVALSVRGHVAGATLLYRGELVEARRRLRDGLFYYDEGDRDTHIRQSGRDTGTTLLAHTGLAQWLAGLPEQAIRTSEEGLAMARRAAHPLSLAQMVNFAAVVRALSRDWEAAAALAAETHELGARFGLPIFIGLGLMLVGMAAAGKGDPSRAADLIRTGVARLRQAGAEIMVPLALPHLALALASSGDPCAALEAGEEAVRLVRANDERCWEAEALRVLGEVKRTTGAADAAEVEADPRSAVDVARRQGAKSFELRAAMSLARLWAEQGKLAQARDLIAPVYGWFSEGFDTPDLKEARSLLDELGGA